MTEQAQGTPSGATEETTVQTETTVQAEAPKPEAPQPELKWTDKDVDKLKGQARKEARERAEREILQRYGLESFDDLTGIVEDHRAVQEATSTETDRERAAREKAEKTLQERQAELDAAYARIAQMAEDQALRDALSGANAKPDKVATLLRLADRDALDVDDDGNLMGVAEQVEALKGSLPELFLDDTPAGVGSNGGRDDSPRSVWDLPADEFQKMQQRVQNGERVVPPKT